MEQRYIEYLSELLSIKTWQIENVISLLDEGNSIPFISRYRKELTGSLDDASLAELKHWIEHFKAFHKRKEYIKSVIEEQDKLSKDLSDKIDNTLELSELEDLYLPFKPKKRTRAAIAIQRGLEPLATKIWQSEALEFYKQARAYISDDLPTLEDVISGVRDILAEKISEQSVLRDYLRDLFRKRYILIEPTRKAANDENAKKYKAYFNTKESLERMPAHRLLAVLRAENEGFVSVKIDADKEKAVSSMLYLLSNQGVRPNKTAIKDFRLALEDAFVRLLSPAISNEVLKEFKQRADKSSINIFGENLRQLLLASPLPASRIMAIDPGFRNGCKIACIDEKGDLLEHCIIYPHPPQNNKIEAIEKLNAIIDRNKISAIAIGNGTASRETESFVKKIDMAQDIKIFVVSEDGASIYSASQVAREEFPDEDVTVRGAVSIARRLMDPLSELLKIDPKSLGVGQYQYDVDQKLLAEKLDSVVEFCVDTVGIDLNTASKYLLRYVSGIGESVAQNIVDLRSKIGSFTTREQLKLVPRLGAKAFEQCAAFLRIRDGREVLDNTAVHPETYHIVYNMAKRLGVQPSDLIRNESLLSSVDANDYVDEQFGLPTINDIIKELLKPSRDPRAKAEDFAFNDDVHDIEDLVIGMELPAKVTNITAFGVFVDIGVHHNALIHISKLGRKISPEQLTSFLSLNQAIRVRVLSVDIDRKRINLELINNN